MYAGACHARLRTRHCAAGEFGRPSPPPRGPRAPCFCISWPVGQYNRGDATQGLVAGSGADVMNCSRLVGCKVGPCGAALASHASETHK